MFILIKIQGWSLTTVLIRFKWKLILCSICGSGAFTFPATSGDCPYSQSCYIWHFNLVKRSTRSFGTDHKPDAGSYVKSQLYFGLPLVVTEIPSSEILVLNWLSTQGNHGSIEVNSTIILLSTISCLGEILLTWKAWECWINRTGSSAWERELWDLADSCLGCGSVETYSKSKHCLWGIIVSSQTFRLCLSIEVVPLQKQEVPLFLVCGGVWVLCYLHLLAETTSLQSCLSKYEIS